MCVISAFSLDYIFQSNSYYDEVVENGFFAGDGLYVGSVTYENRSYIASLWSGGCSFATDKKVIALKMEECAYLVKEPKKFEWIKPTNGKIEDRAVIFGSAVAGRGQTTVKPAGLIYRVGEISMQEKGLVTMADKNRVVLSSYEVLLFKKQ